LKKIYSFPRPETSSCALYIRRGLNWTRRFARALAAAFRPMKVRARAIDAEVIAGDEGSP
jgi:ATP-dependent DNA ligase